MRTGEHVGEERRRAEARTHILEALAQWAAGLVKDGSSQRPVLPPSVSPVGHAFAVLGAQQAEDRRALAAMVRDVFERECVAGESGGAARDSECAASIHRYEAQEDET